jgi:hypothetical protein
MDFNQGGVVTNFAIVSHPRGKQTTAPIVGSSQGLGKVQRRLAIRGNEI